MKRAFTILSMVLLATQGWAITWNFDQEGDSQGWIARDSDMSGTIFAAPLRSEVADGIWRMFLPPYEEGRRPALELVSPLLHRDSALFDQLRLRFRIVHSRPLEGSFYLLWTNAFNRSHAGGLTMANPDSSANGIDVLGFCRNQQMTYTTDWQEVVIGGLQSEVFTVGNERWQRVWEGELLDVRLKLNLFTESVGVPFEPGPEAMPEAIEVDWIQLTGVEEQMQGELPPPAGTGAISLGHYFAPPAFYPISLNGLGWGVDSGGRAGQLGDVDGDQDLDLVCVWRTMTGYGWMVARNEGQGRFAGPVQVENFPPGSGGAQWITMLDAADLNKDGRLEVMAGCGSLWTRLLDYRQEEGWGVFLEKEQVFSKGLGDADGDGDADLWVLDPRADYQPIILLNDGQGRFASQIAMPAEQLHREGLGAFRLVSQMPGGQRVGLLWAPGGENPYPGYMVTSLGQGGETVVAPLALEAPPDLIWIRYVGDFDQDGDVDLIAVTAEDSFGGDRFRGLELLVNPGDGRLVRVPWYDEQVSVRADVRFFDLDGDGRLDPVFMDSNFRGPAVVVGVGQPEGVPIQEGRYPLEGGGGEILGGDVDGDGDTDLVVLENRKIGGGSGVWVLLNQLSERRNTVVTEALGRQPAGFRLGANYPNPFNPQTWIPFEAPEGDQPVSLKVYNVLGQPVRTLVEGRLGAGPHLVPWDGRDSRGQLVSSGAYLYRLQVGNQQAAGKMVKSQ